MRARTILSPDAMALKEKFFDCGMEILRPVNYMIADSHPLEFREKMSSQYSRAAEEEYEKTVRRARNLLYEQRNLVQDKWLPRYDIARSKTSGGADWEEMRSLLVDRCLDRLSEMLITHSPLLVDAKYVKPLQETVLKVTETQKNRLNEFLKSFYAVRREGVPTLEEEYA